MKYIFLLFIFLSGLCSAQTVHYELVTIMSVRDNFSKSVDSLFFEKGTFHFDENEIIQKVDSFQTKYPILSASREDDIMYFETTNKYHEFILIGSDHFIGGAIRIAILKDDRTLIYTYNIKCIE